MKILSSQISPAEREEALRFMRPFAPSVEIARTFRGEEPSGQQQQQQQQQQQAPTDPFAGIDLSLVDDATRQAIESSRATLQQLQTTSAASAQELAQLRQRIEQQSQQQQQPQAPTQRQQPPPATLEEELIEFYLENGVTTDRKTAANFAKIQSGIMERGFRRFGSQLNQSLQPVIGNVLDNTAADAFDHVRQSDAMGYMQIPEVAQQVWDRLSQMAEQGQMVSKEVATNFARIFAMQHFETNGFPTNVGTTNHTPPAMPGVPQIRVLPPVGSPTSQQTRFTYPGAGHVVTQQRQVTRGESPLDPDTQAAIDATTANWPKKATK